MDRVEFERSLFSIEPDDSPEVIFDKRLKVFESSIARSLADINKLPNPRVTQKHHDDYEFLYHVWLSGINKRYLLKIGHDFWADTAKCNCRHCRDNRVISYDKPPATNS